MGTAKSPADLISFPSPSTTAKAPVWRLSTMPPRVTSAIIGIVHGVSSFKLAMGAKRYQNNAKNSKAKSRPKAQM